MADNRGRLGEHAADLQVGGDVSSASEGGGDGGAADGAARFRPRVRGAVSLSAASPGARGTTTPRKAAITITWREKTRVNRRQRTQLAD
jgi:hypothetical protein